MGIFSIFKNLFKSQELFTYYGIISHVRIFKDRLKTNYVSYQGMGMGESTYKVTVIFQLNFKNKGSKRFRFSLRGTDLPVFDLNKGDFAQVMGIKKPHGFHIQQVKAHNVVYSINKLNDG